MNATAWLVKWKLLGEPQTLTGPMFATIPARAFPLLAQKPRVASVNGNVAFVWRLPLIRIGTKRYTAGISIRRSQPEDTYTCWCWGTAPSFKDAGPQIWEGDDLVQILHDGICELNRYTADYASLDKAVTAAVIIATERLGAGARSGTEGKKQG